MSGSGSATKRSIDGEMKGRQSPMDMESTGVDQDKNDLIKPVMRQLGGEDINGSNHGDNSSGGGTPVAGKNKKGRLKTSLNNGSAQPLLNGATGEGDEAKASPDGGCVVDEGSRRGRPSNHSTTAMSLAAAQASAAPAQPPPPIQPPAPLSVTSEEINFLLYRYLQECGFVHSSFTFAHESGVGRVRPRNSGSIPPGALVMFLQKGLQYVGLEEVLDQEVRAEYGLNNATAGEGEPVPKRPKGSALDEAKANGADLSCSEHPPGPDFSLLCPRALGTLARRDPPIKLRVPPASAAAATKAMMEMEEKVTREQRSGEETRRARALAEESGRGGLKNQTLELRGAKDGTSDLGNNEIVKHPVTAEQRQAPAMESAAALPTPKKRKKKKRGGSKTAEEEDLSMVASMVQKDKKRANSVEAEEIKSSSKKGSKSATAAAAAQQNREQQQQAAVALAKAAAAASASQNSASSSMGQIEATAAAMRAAAAGQGQFFPPGMAAAAAAMLANNQKGSQGAGAGMGQGQQLTQQQLPHHQSRDGTPLQQKHQQQGFHGQQQQKQVRQQQEYHQMEIKRMQDAQRFQEAQRMQQEQQAQHHRMQQEMWSQQQQQSKQNRPPSAPGTGGGPVDSRGPPQSYQSQIDAGNMPNNMGSTIGGNMPHPHQQQHQAQAEVENIARQRAEIQAVLVQRQQAVQAMAQQKQQGGQQQGIGQQGLGQSQLPQQQSQGMIQQQGIGQQQQGMRTNSQGREEESARVNAIAALMSAAAGTGVQQHQGGQTRINQVSSGIDSIPQGMPSSSIGNAMGNAAIHQGHGNLSQNGGQQQQAPIMMPGDKRGSQDQRHRNMVNAASPGDCNTQTSNSQPSAATIEEEDRLTSIPPTSVLELSQHTSEVFMCAWNPRFTSLIATGSGDASARIWAIDGADAASANSSGGGGGCCSILLPHGHDSCDKKNKDVTTLEWSTDGELLATGSYDGVARVWSRSGELRQTLKGHRGPIFSLKWNRRGNFLLSGSYDKSTIVWDITGEVGFVKQQFSYHFAPALDVDWKDDLTFASCSTDKTVQICRVGLARPIKTYTGHGDEVNAVKWDPSGTLLASCSDDCTAKVWDVNSPRNEPRWDFKSHQQEIYTVKWSPTGPGSRNPDKLLMLATASFDGSVRLWNVADGTCLRILSRHRESVYSVAFSPSGEYLASGSLAGQLYIWNVRDGAHIRSFKGKGDIFEVAWNIEETRVAACFSSNVVSVIDFKKI